MTPSGRFRATAVLPLLTLVTAACAHTECDAGSPASAGSCAGIIAIAGVTYIPGRGDGAPPVPLGGRELHGTLVPCDDGCAPGPPVVAHGIPGIPVTEAVAGPVANELMLAERLWQVPKSSLPAALQPFVAR